jgi:hypothetical protein
MTQADRKALIREYRETARPAGVFAVRNTVTGAMLVGSAPDLPGMLNRQRFQLEMGSHPSRELQADWNELGEGAFAFEVLDTLDEPGDPTESRASDLQALLELWLEKLAESGETLYRQAGRSR